MMILITCLLLSVSLFLLDDEPEYDVFEFNDLCSATNCLLASTFISESVSRPASLELKPFPDSLKYSFLGVDESLHVIITSDLDWDQEKKIDCIT